MTPKQKAKEIYFAMLNAGKGFTSDYLAIQCALIAVDEIIDSQPTFGCGECGGGEKDYWLKVKKEIKKIGNLK